MCNACNESGRVRLQWGIGLQKQKSLRAEQIQSNSFEVQMDAGQPLNCAHVQPRGPE